MRPGPDLVSLGDRFAVLQGVRAIMAVAVVAVAPVLPDVAGAPNDRLAPLVLTWLSATSAIELLRRRLRRRGLGVVGILLLLDGIVVALAVARTGGHQSLLLFLVYLHVVAVTLLVSYRTGLKVAAWHAVLLFVGHAAVAAGVLGADVALPPSASAAAAALHAVGFLLVAIGAAGFSAMNEHALHRGRAELHALVDMGAVLGRTLTIDEVTLALLGHVRDRLGFSRVTVLTWGQDRWQGAVDTGAGPILLESATIAGDLVARAWTAGEPTLVADLDAESDDLLAAVLPGARNVVIVPLLVDGDPLGILLAEWGGGRRSRIPSGTVATLVESAAHAALALRNAWLLAQVRILASRDALTGLWNRRVLDESLGREIERAHRSDEPLTLVLLDIDHFKAVNDTHGHQAGDTVLRQVGAALANVVRGGDLAARYGGEELAVLLPGCAREDAPHVADRLRRTVGEAVTAVPVTLSAGVATVPGNAFDATGLVSAADAALYEAKRGGRNRTAISSQEPSGPPPRRLAPLRAVGRVG